MAIDWANLRKYRFSPERPEHWSTGVYGISLEGVNLLGIHEQTGKLYWDGKEIVTKTSLGLGTPERWLAGFAAAGTFGSFLVNLARAFQLWH